MKMSDRDQIEAGQQAWLRIKSHSQKCFEDWLVLSKALEIGRNACLKAAGANRPFGSRYTKAMGAWLRETGLDDLNHQERARALLVLQHLPAVTVWRAGLPDAVRRKLNHPNAIWRSWRRSITIAERPSSGGSKERPPEAAAQPVVPSAPAEISRHARYGKAKAIYWSQDALRRAHGAMILSRSSDLLTLARVALQAAIRNEADLLALLDPPAKEPRQIATRPAAVELHPA
jgi:hypothetical protein